MKILVVDDNPMNREMLRELLGALGHAVEIAEDGAQACVATEAHDYELVLMDLHMPIMNGAEAIAVIKARPKPAPRLIVVTADHSVESHAKCMAAGADGVSTKPLNIKKLIAIVAAAEMVFPQATAKDRRCQS